MRLSDELRGVGYDELLQRLATMAASERLLGTAIVEHLCEVEARGLHLDIGFGSLFAYCCDGLGFSADVAYKRVKVARAVAGRPEILEYLESGELSLSSVVVLAPHLGDESDAAGLELVEAARGKSKREVERLIAERVPGAAPPRGSELRLIVSERLAELLREARDLEGGCDPAAILEKALEGFVETRSRQRFAQTDRPLATPRETRTDRIPSHVKREVYLRDGGLCSFVGAGPGAETRACGSTFLLEYDHVIPRARGGESTAGNIRLLCRTHNARAAERILGKECVEAARERARVARDEQGARVETARRRERAQI